jgi:hypothetical protein
VGRDDARDSGGETTKIRAICAAVFAGATVDVKRVPENVPEAVAKAALQARPIRADCDPGRTF